MIVIAYLIHTYLFMSDIHKKNMEKKIEDKENVPMARTEKGDVALREEEVLAFWNEHSIFKKTVETPAGNTPVGDFVFYDGPPICNGGRHTMGTFLQER
jgi:isoleucyl-tRNA synthetase